MKFSTRVLVIALAFAVGLYIRVNFFGSEQPVAANNATTSQQVASNYTWQKISGPTMGTSFNISYSAEKGQQQQDVALVEANVKALLESFNKEFSTYDPTSVISKFNLLEDSDTKYPVSVNYATIVKKATEITQLTNGYFDITVYPLVKAWGFGPGKAQVDLTEEQVQALKQHVGNDKYALIDEQGQYYLQKHDPQITHDMSAIAKGYAVDLVAQLLDNANINNYLVEIGGEIRTKGVNDAGQDWVLAIEQPNFDGTFDINTKIQINGHAIATSGNYRNFRFAGGKRVTHEINPFTGRPIEHNTASISVVADDCMTADALATGLYVMGSQKALELAQANNIAVFIIDFEDGKFVTKKSAAFDKLVTIVP